MRPLAVVDEVIAFRTDGDPEVLLAYAQRTGQNVKRAAAGAEGPVLDHYSAAAAQAHLGGSVIGCSTRCRPSSSVGVLRQPRGLRRGLDARTARGVRPAARVRAASGALRWCWTVRTRRRSARTTTARSPELYQENFVAVVPPLGGQPGRVVPDPELRDAAGNLSSYRFADLFEGEGWGWTGDHPDPVGVVGRAPLRPRGDVGGSLDLGALPVLPGHPARPEGRGARAPAQRDQPAHRPRLAVLAAVTPPGSAGSSTPPEHSTTATPGGRRCPR